MKTDFMKRAIELARLSADENEVPVGAVIVYNGHIIGEGRNRREALKLSTSHAEIEAINEACRTLGSWRLNDCDLYVTMEPCPMCAGAVINSRIRRVYAGVPDENFGACGSVTNLFECSFNWKPDIFYGLCEDECRTLLKVFFAGIRAK